MQLKYYKVSIQGRSYPLYYAAYNLEEAKEAFEEDKKQFDAEWAIGSFQEIDYIAIPCESIGLIYRKTKWR